MKAMMTIVWRESIYKNGIKCWLKYEDYAKRMLEDWWEKNTEYEAD